MRINLKNVEITAAVLKASESGAGITRIMYSANLSYNVANKYLKIMLGADLLRLNDCSYEVTEKGENYLKRYSILQDANLSLAKILRDNFS